MNWKKSFIVLAGLTTALLWLAANLAVGVAGWLLAIVNHETLLGIGFVVFVLGGEVVLVNLPPIKRHIRRQAEFWNRQLAE